jgi:hypothetical protein
MTRRKRSDPIARTVSGVDLTTLGSTLDNVVELNVISVVGLDISGETSQSTLDGLLRGRVHHARLV